MLQNYRASGRCGSTFYLATLGLMLLAAAGGAVYQKVVDVVPFIYVNVLLTLGFGFLISVAMARAQALGRCRNAQAALLAGVLVAGAALGGSHFAAFKFWQSEVVDSIVTEAGLEMQREGVPAEERRALRAQVRADVLEAADFSAYVEARFEGGWTIGLGGGTELTGIFVVLVWLVEAGILLVAGVKGGTATKGDAYCEACDQWVDTVRGRIVTGNPKRANVAAIRGADTAAALFPEGAIRFDDVHSHLVHQWKECAGCRQGFLDVIVLKYVPNDKGEVQTETEAIRSNVLMDDEVVQAFEAAAATAAAAEKEALTPKEQDPSEPS